MGKQTRVFIKKRRSSSAGWTMGSILTTMVIPAAFAILPGIRKRYGVGMLSVPSLAVVAGLYVWKRTMERRHS